MLVWGAGACHAPRVHGRSYQHLKTNAGASGHLVSYAFEPQPFPYDYPSRQNPLQTSLIYQEKTKVQLEFVEQAAGFQSPAAAMLTVI